MQLPIGNALGPEWGPVWPLMPFSKPFPRLQPPQTTKLVVPAVDGMTVPQPAEVEERKTPALVYPSQLIQPHHGLRRLRLPALVDPSQLIQVDLRWLTCVG